MTLKRDDGNHSTYQPVHTHDVRQVSSCVLVCWHTVSVVLFRQTSKYNEQFSLMIVDKWRHKQYTDIQWIPLNLNYRSVNENV